MAELGTPDAHRSTVVRPPPPPSERVTPPIAVLSDIHGNRHALDAVLRAVREAGAAAWWCLGDVVGYGADPRHCLRRCLDEAGRLIAGNHDLAAAGRIPLADFAGWAEEALVWTQRALGPVNRDRLAALEPEDATADPPLFHASPRDPVWEYVTTPMQARAALLLREEPLVLVGHTHVASAWRLDGAAEVTEAEVGDGTTLPLGQARWLVNPGSVGQPRDGDARAAWALLDIDAGTLTFRRTPYDVAGAQNAILQAGLPPLLAARLAEGL